MSKFGVFFGPNTGKYWPEKTPYQDTFHAVDDFAKEIWNHFIYKRLGKGVL